MSNSGDMEPEEAEPPVEGWEHQPTHKTFEPKFILPKRNAGAESQGKDNQQPVQLATHPLGQHQLLLMILCYACKQSLELSSERLYPAANGNRCRYPQSNISLGHLGRVGEGLKALKSIGRPPESTKLDPWELLKSLSHQPQCIHDLKRGPNAYVANGQLNLHGCLVWLRGTGLA